jgi:pyrimidine operon attenuation protein / uracil phosphoribosyltransferase
MRPLLDPESAGRVIRRMAGEIVERAGGADHLALVGIRRGGVPLAEAIASHIETLEHVRVPIGSVDISLYRDDAATALPNPRIGRSEIPFGVQDLRIVLVDDVLYTGRTVRAALDALLDYGRPQNIKLAVLIDRGGRELPIQPDFVGKAIDAEPEDLVEVVSDESGIRAEIRAKRESA